MLASRCGYSADLSGPVNDRALCHVDNAYFLEHVEIVSHRCKTHTVSNTAFRGFGGPQGMMAIEAVMDDIARRLGRDPLDVRRANFYGVAERNVTPYGMTVADNILHVIADRLEASSGYRERRQEIDAVQRGEPGREARHRAHAGEVRHFVQRRALQPGRRAAPRLHRRLACCSTTAAPRWVRASTPRSRRSSPRSWASRSSACASPAADTSKVPNTSATAASSGSDSNGKAAQAAARDHQGAARRLRRARAPASTPEAVRFEDGRVVLGGAVHGVRGAGARSLRSRASSCAPRATTARPKIHFDRATFNGRPFFYFAYGAAVSEVAIDTLTGESRLLRVDILHDVGRSLNPAMDLGQVEGGFLQGVGWLTSEELWWNEAGELKTHAPSTYKIPTACDWPAEARVELLEDAPNREDTIYRSKAVGEPPLMLAISVFHAIRDAVASCGGRGAAAALSAPATPESILRAHAAACKPGRAPDSRAANGRLLSRVARISSGAGCTSITGIAWIGASFYFVWLDNHLQPPARSRGRREGRRAASCGRCTAAASTSAQKYRVAPRRAARDAALVQVGSLLRPGSRASSCSRSSTTSAPRSI